MTQHDLLHRAVRICGHRNQSSVQFLRAYPKPASVIHDQLQAIAPRIREKKHMAALRIAAQMIAHQPVKAIEVLAHVRCAGCHIDPRRRSKPEHRLRPVQYGQQALQRPRIESTMHFDPTPASQLNHQNTDRARHRCSASCAGGPNHFHRKHRPGHSTAVHLCTRRRYLSSVPTAKPRCWQNASRSNPLASNSATNASASARLRRLRTTPTSLITPVHH